MKQNTAYLESKKWDDKKWIFVSGTNSSNKVEFLIPGPSLQTS